MAFRIKNIGFLVIIALVLQFNYTNAQTVRYVPSSYSTIASAVSAASAGDTIDITGTFTESTINVNLDLIFKGHDTASSVIINSGGLSAVFLIRGGIVKIMNLTIRNGCYGVSISDTASVTISSCNITANSVSGVYLNTVATSPVLDIIKSNISQNGGDTTGSYGAGICNNSCGTVNITGSSINLNKIGNGYVCKGAGIFGGRNSVMNIYNSDINANTSAGILFNKGGGIYLDTFSTCHIDNCNINYNTVSGGTRNHGGGIYAERYANLILAFSNINGNTASGSVTWRVEACGGGLYITEYDSTVVKLVTNCLVYNNTVSGAYNCLGAGFFIDSRRTHIYINNTTIHKNRIINGGGYSYGGGMWVRYEIYVNNCTITENSVFNTSNGEKGGGGIYGGIEGAIRNSIVTNNTVQGNDDIRGCLRSFGHNILSQSWVTCADSSDFVGINPLLDTLKDNGGPTFTQALLNGSPALNAAAATDLFGNKVNRDQRNSMRYGLNDIGAYEKNNSVEQITGNICTVFNNLAILKIMIYSQDTATITSLSFTTDGTTATKEILRAKLYFTASSDTFSLLNQYGSDFNFPDSLFTFNGNVRFNGSCYFWLVYDISNNPVPGHRFDASVYQISMDTLTFVTDISDPAGYRYVPVVQAAYTINDSTQCFEGNSFVFTNNSTATSGTLTYNWIFGDGNVSTASSPTCHYALPDTCLVRLIARTNEGCADTLFRRNYVFPDPQAGFSISDSTQCLAGNLFVFSETSKISSGTVDSMKWDFGDQVKSFDRNPMHHYQATGIYDVQQIVKSNFGCIDTAKQRMFIFPASKTNFTVNDSSQCLDGNNFVFTNKTSGDSNYRSDWYFSDGAQDTVKNPNHSYSKSGNYIVMLVTATSQGCTDTFIKTVMVKPSPVSAFTVNDSTQCLSGNSFLFTNHSTIDTGTLVYGWDFGDTTTANLQNPVHSYRYNGTYRVTLTAVSVQACSSQVSCGAYVFKDPQPVIKTTDTIQCFKGNLFTFSPAVINAGSKYGWNFGDGNTDTVITVNHHYSSAGDYKLSLTETTKEGCSGSTGKTVHVSVSPTASFSVNDTAQCLSGNLFTFRNTGTTSITACDWQFGDGKTGSGNQVNYSYTNAGSFTVTMILTGNEDCKDTVQKQVIVVLSPEAGFAVNDSVQCQGDNHFIFTNFSNALAVKFFWDFGDGNNSGNKDTDHSYLNSGTYTVLLVASSSENCTDSIQKTITLTPQPPAPTTSSNSPVCQGDLVELYAQTTGNASYSWSSANGFISTQQNPVIAKSTRKDAGDYFVKAMVDGCESEDSKVSVVVNPLPAVDLGNDSNLCAGDHKILDAGEFASYLWQDNSTERLYDAKEPGIYYVGVTDENNCKGSDTIVFLNKCPAYLYIPNAFTPNGDSLNETFNIVISNITEFRLQVYNRWGEKVFESFDPAFQWDGKYRGTLCESGYYYFSIVYLEELGKLKAVNGQVFLLR